MIVTVTEGRPGSPAIFRAAVGAVDGWVDSEGVVFVTLPYERDGFASFTVRNGDTPDLTIFADHLHGDITALVDGLRAAWETGREDRMRAELERLKVALGVTE